MPTGPLSGEELPVRGVDSAGLEVLLRFFYTGEVSLTYLNIIPVSVMQLTRARKTVQTAAGYSSTSSTAWLCTVLLPTASRSDMHRLQSDALPSLNYKQAHVTHMMLHTM